MPIDTAPADYFDTPERSERLQLVIHLLNNADQVPYLRGPVGAGKTRFALRLVEQVQTEYAVVWLTADRIASLRSDLCSELGLDADRIHWPGDLLGAHDRPQLLVIVDNADALDLQAIADLFELHAVGARLLLLGQGGLAPLQGQRELQFVDLPPFTEPQSLAFLNAAGRGAVTRLGEAAARGLHRASGGWPGHLVNALTALPGGAGKARAELAPRRLSTQALLFSGTLALLLLAALLYQDRINEWFEPERLPSDEPPVLVSAPPPPVVPAVDQTPASEAAVGPAASALAEPAAAPSSIPLAPVTTEQRPVFEPTAVDQSPVIEGDGTDPKAPAKSVVSIVPPAADAQVLDEVIDAAIAAAAQPPEATQPIELPAAGTPPSTQASSPATPAEVSAKKVVPSKPAAATLQATETQKPQPASGLAWLKAQAPQRYTLQVLGARERSAIEQFVQQHKLQPPFAVFARQLKGKPWYSLVVGSYPDRDAAVAARIALPKSLAEAGVWPRTFSSIFKQIGP